MTHTRPWPRIKALFQEMLDAPAPERPSRLDHACGGDAALRAEVEALLAAHDTLESEGETSRFLEGSAPVFDLAALDDPGIADAAMIGRAVGGYRILSRLGEGGMGVVYEAEQQSPRRRVALKMARGGAWVEESRLRAFRREAEALARLRHPGIAAIYEAGTTEDGRHFFAMELVRGEALDDHLARRLPLRPGDRGALRERLGLFLEICATVAYAHQRGVIHRDLKPSNILVLGEADDSGSTGPQPRVKLLDFGLARLMDTDDPAGVTRTTYRAVQGTLDYLSPEQARGDPDEIDLRTDIYSLGLLLYEMLTGRKPLALERADLPEALRRICEESPRPPGAFDRALAGDLDTIVLKALEKDPARRYQSVGALAEDVSRHLADLPILARPATLVYQLRKLAVRHRAAALLGSALLVAVVLGAAGTTVGMIRARASAAEARAQAETAEQVSGFLEQLFRVSDPSEARGNAITARELLDAGVARIDTSLAKQPAVKGQLLGVMGEVYRQLGLYRDAQPLFARALELKRSALGPDDPRVATQTYALAGLCRRLGDYDAARGHYEEALRIREEIYEPDHTEIAVSLAGLANLMMETGDLDGAVPLYRRCIAIVEADKGPDHPGLALYLSNLSLLHRARGEYAEAKPLAERAVSIQERALGANHLDLAYDLRGLGGALIGLGRHAEARAVFERTLAIQEPVLGPDHVEVAETLGSIGDAYLRDGQAAAARVPLERALAIYEGALGPQHPHAIRTRDNLSVAHRGQGDFETAVALSERSLGELEAALGRDHPSVVIVLEHLGQHHTAAGHPERARPPMERALAMRDSLFGANSEEASRLRRELAEVALALGDAPAARGLYAQATEAAAAHPEWADSSWDAAFERGAALHRDAGLADSAEVLLARKRLMFADR